MRTLGSDPELLLADSNGVAVSAIGLFGGSKNKPKKLGIGYIQEDNVCLEFNTPPASTRDEWVENHMVMLSNIQKLLNKKGLSTLGLAAYDFPVQYLKATPKAMEFGCSPEIYSKTGGVIDPPSAKTPLRTAGGHVHVGGDIYKNWDIAKESVTMLGSVLYELIGHSSKSLSFAEKNSIGKRENLYGNRYSMRIKPYGFEWRGPHSMWLKNEETIGWMWDAVNLTLDLKESGVEEPYIIQTEIRTSLGAL